MKYVSPPTIGRSNTLDTLGYSKIRTERPLDHYTMEHLLTPLVILLYNREGSLSLINQRATTLDGKS